MNIFKALVMREVLDGKNGYIRVPLILAAVTIVLLLLSSIGFGNGIEFNGMHDEGIENLGDAIAMAQEKEAHEMPAGVTLGYWGMTALPWVALPFVIFFSLLGSLYEERRDRSILFWKSMPTADWQEVLAKLFVPIIVAPLIFLTVVAAAQLLIAFLLSLVVLFQGGPFFTMWPLGFMIQTWIGWIVMYLILALWALPMLSWVSLVSGFADRMPFLWAILAPAILIAIEAIFFETNRIGSWIGKHLGGWAEGAFGGMNRHIEGPRDILTMLTGDAQMQALSYTLTSLHFWAGIVIAGGFIYAAIEMRKRAI